MITRACAADAGTTLTARKPAAIITTARAFRLFIVSSFIYSCALSRLRFAYLHAARYRACASVF
jgi:hypothetical protein